MPANNKQYNIKQKIADFDACSLYSSAMYVIAGLLQGLPQVLKYMSYDFLKYKDGYFISIKVIELNKQLDFPLTSEINEDGVREFTNDMENETVCVDKVGLEDLNTFHEAELEIVDGYYVNEGRNNTINHVIQDIYDLRKICSKIKRK